MPSAHPEIRTIKTLSFPSESLNRKLRIDFYLPPAEGDGNMDVLLINDGQDLISMDFENILQSLYRSRTIRPLLCVGIHAGPQRRSEYGTAVTEDYKGRGNHASKYMNFITGELVPALGELFPGRLNAGWAIAGFSLGGLSALDIAWRQSRIFKLAGVFSGSLWWRNLDKAHPDYRDDQHRIMHNQIRTGECIPGMKFFFECGTADETEDRNGNGIIDSIDDTKDLISDLLDKGYRMHSDICYHEIENGTHDVATWSAAMPVFLRWGFPR